MKQVSMTYHEFTNRYLEENVYDLPLEKVKEIIQHEYETIPFNMLTNEKRMFVQFEDGIYHFFVYETKQGWMVKFGVDDAKIQFKDKVNDPFFEEHFQHFERLKEINEGMKKVHKLYQAINKK